MSEEPRTRHPPRMPDDGAGTGTRTRSAVVDGLRVSYEELGTGEAVMLLHGSGPGASAAGNWAATIEHLAPLGYRVIAPDVVGFGGSDRPANFRYDAVGWADNIAGLIEVLGLGRVHLVGNSMGGRIALQLAAVRAPEQVATVTVMGVRSHRSELSQGLQRVRGYDGTREGLRTMFEDLFVVDPALVTDSMVDTRYAAASRPGEVEHYRRMFAHPHANELGLDAGQLGGISQPVLVLHGREDRVVPLSDGIDLATAIPDCQCVIVPNCGHWVQTEQADRFIAQVGLFLGLSQSCAATAP